MGSMDARTVTNGLVGAKTSAAAGVPLRANGVGCDDDRGGSSPIFAADCTRRSNSGSNRAGEDIHMDSNPGVPAALVSFVVQHGVSHAQEGALCREGA